MTDPDTGHGRTIVDTIADNAADAGVVLGGRPAKPLEIDIALGGRAALPQRRDRGVRRGRGRAQPSGQQRGVARQQAGRLRRAVSRPARSSWPGRSPVRCTPTPATSSTPTTARSAPSPVDSPPSHRARPRRSDDLLPDLHRRAGADRPVGLLGQRVLRRDLRRIRTGLVADRRRALAQRPAVAALPAPGGGRLPGAGGGAAPGGRSGADQAAARHRSPEPAAAHDRVGRSGPGGGGGHPLPAPRRAGGGLGAGPGLPLEPDRRGTPPPPTRTSPCWCRSRAAPASTPSRRSPARTASTASSSDRPTWPPRWATSAIRSIPTSSPPSRGRSPPWLAWGRRSASTPSRRRGPVARIELGCRFILVGADVTLLARGSEDLATRFGAGPRAGPVAGR